MGISAGTNPIQHIYVGGPDYSAIQGPCDSGFHIPTTAEFTGLNTMLNNRGLTDADWHTYLHFPKSGYLARATGQIITTYGYCRYWCCNMTDNAKADAWGIEANNTVQMYLNDKPANGYSIRAFKDDIVQIDDSNISEWTPLKTVSSVDGAIMYNSSLGLISIVTGFRDFIFQGTPITVYYTIQDKNVGATTVYNNDDTVTNANAGYFFQFGNNNGFPYSGATSFYTTTQTVSGYGPGNYYSDSHFVKVSSNNWFTGTNNNIWGGVTGVVPATEVLEVYRGTTKIWPQSQPVIPIPTNGLLGYWPLESDLLDASGNGKDGSWYSGTGSFSTVGGKTGAGFTGDGRKSTQHIVTTLSYSTPTITMLGWIYFTSLSSSEYRWNGIMANSIISSTESFMSLACKKSSSNAWSVGYPNGHLVSSTLGTTGSWVFVAGTLSNSGAKLYINGSLVTSNSTSYTTSQGDIWRLGCGQYGVSGSSTGFGGGGNGYIRQCAIYNRELSASEITDIYTATA